jgi:23S rRNA (uracil1939-C5)-methyltransferase
VGRRRRGPRQPIAVRVDHLTPKGPAGLDGDGRTWRVRAAPIGAEILAAPGRKHTARRLELITPAPDAVEPQCPVFGVCGGCQLQEMPLAAQRREKQRMVERLVEMASAPVRGADSAYGYRNKVELSFGTRAYTREVDAESDTTGDFLGFHPPRWFSKIVPIDGCPLASPAMNAAIAAVASDLPGPAWDSRAHTGEWRHIVVREGSGVVVTLVTTPDVDAAQVQTVADRLAAVDAVRGVVWVVTDRLSDVAQGDERAVLYGVSHLEVTLGGVRMHLPHDAFFQVNTAGAEVLIETIREALGPPQGGGLLDLYCGVGAIGLALGRAWSPVIGIDITESAIALAKHNAALNEVGGQWHAGKVEDVLPGLVVERPSAVVVDPPRAGLHPAAARFLAGLDADVLVYVACNPASLARDKVVLEAGGWILERLWTVDLFPQTPHVEAVGRFVRGANVSAVAPVQAR